MGNLEVLLHIGLDTLKMRGEGFDAKVKAGDQVRTGDELIGFDLDKVATSAKSLLTQMVITDTDRISSLTPRTGLVTAGADDVAEVTLAGGEGEGAAEGALAPAGRSVTSHAVILPNPEGLHARPAAVPANLAQKYESDIRFKRGNDQANAKSVMAIMGLGEEGLVPVLEAEATTSLAPAATTLSAWAPSARPAPRSEDPSVLLGGGLAGLGVGRVVRVFHEDIEAKEDAADRHKERRLLNQAIDRAMVQLENLENRLRQDADADKAAIFGAHRQILHDPDLLDIASSAIDKGKSAAFAWRRAYTTYADRLAGSTNEPLAQRATDVRDVGPPRPCQPRPRGREAGAVGRPPQGPAVQPAERRAPHPLSNPPHAGRACRRRASSQPRRTPDA
jgi:multiphosphoryl transfer protein